MSYYRDTYLKSGDWKSLRLEALMKSKHTCKLCRNTGVPLDVHHFDYKNLYDVKRNDLAVLCRPCHNSVHALMEKYPKLKSLSKARQWFIVSSHLAPNRERILDAIVRNAKLFNNPVPTRKEMRERPNYYQT